MDNGMLQWMRLVVEQSLSLVIAALRLAQSGSAWPERRLWLGAAEEQP
jgi:hypothetical protein